MNDGNGQRERETEDRPRRSATGDRVGRTLRKPYASPKLTRHGTIVRQTATVGGDTDSFIFESDRALKSGIAPVDGAQVLARTAALPISTWSYRGESARHLGPMAQDFSAAFGLGADDRHIHVVDASGVALAAIQGLHGIVQAQAARLAALERELAMLRESPDASPRLPKHGGVEAHTAADPGLSFPG
jgi:hypothetical protein